MDKDLVSIILPYYNHWDLTHARLYEFYRFLPENCEIVLVNDASPDTDCETGAAWWQKNAHHRIRYVKLEKNRGFGGAHNKGAQIAKGNVLVFYSNDVVCSGNFIPALTEKIHRVKGEKHKLIGGRLIDWAGGWNEVSVNGNSAFIPYAEGWFLACTRLVWDALGGFDPRYGKFDYEDIDLSVTAYSIGVEVLALDSPYLQHLGAQTITPLNVDRLAHTQENQKRFLEKWNDQFPTIFEKWDRKNGKD